MSFSTLGLSEPILRAVADTGYSEPTPIQTRAIPVILSGKGALSSPGGRTGRLTGVGDRHISWFGKGDSARRYDRYFPH